MVLRQRGGHKVNKGTHAIRRGRRCIFDGGGVEFVAEDELLAHPLLVPLDHRVHGRRRHTQHLRYALQHTQTVGNVLPEETRVDVREVPQHLAGTIVEAFGGRDASLVASIGHEDHLQAGSIGHVRSILPDDALPQRQHKGEVECGEVTQQPMLHRLKLLVESVKPHGRQVVHVAVKPPGYLITAVHATAVPLIEDAVVPCRVDDLVGRCERQCQEVGHRSRGNVEQQ
mmetsp:Transcript_2614/g.5911  ORF Transcript_2614/g.5911 Transcript_2614/m.5911 type:complete len:228 (-) Transcript_2614:136-819(-)